MIERGFLVSPERVEIKARGVMRQGNELLTRDKPTPTPQRDQLADPVAVPGNSEGLAVLHSVHDLPRSRPEIALTDLGVSRHSTMVALGAIECYEVASRKFAARGSREAWRKRRMVGASPGRVERADA
jgi:hypothetical protein